MAELPGLKATLKRGALVAAADFSGDVRVNNAADGKRAGEIDPNPPTLLERLAEAVEPRLYDNNALLLPDARVLVLGGNTARATFRLDGPPPCPDRNESLVLIKLPSVTHGWDSGQRLIPLTTRPVSPSPRTLRFTLPDRFQDNIPPGFFMMFYVDCKGKPSRARFVLFDS